MKNGKLKTLEKLVRGAFVASNYIDKNIKEGKQFKELEHLGSLVDWMAEESGFRDDLVFEAMEDYYNQMLNDQKKQSLFEVILTKEYNKK